MNLEHISLEDLKAKILPIFEAHLDLSQHQVFFFGSRVTGTNSPRSDIDIGILGSASVSLQTMVNIRESVEKLTILYKIDVVDLMATSADFREEALKKIEPLTS